MNLTNEIAQLKAIAGNAEYSSFPQIDKDCDSYWNKSGDVTNENNIIKYGYGAPIELVHNLNDYVDDKTSRILTAVAYKTHNEIKMSKVDSDSKKLPDYVYVF